MAKKLDTLGVRLVTAVIFVGVIIAGLFCQSAVPMWIIFMLLVTVGLYEYQTITGTNKYGFVLAIVHALFGGYFFFAATMLLSLRGGDDPVSSSLLILPYVFYILFYAVGEMFRTREQPIEEVAKAFWGHIYVALPFALLMTLYLRSTDGYYYLLPIFVLVWFNDTGAYFIGSLLGKHKLLERVSPKKTIEGTLGGVIGAVLGALAFYYLGYGLMSLVEWLIFGAVVGISATMGDLYESFTKRQYGTKDSGWIFPGHGGVLDRVDSLLVVSVVAYFFYAFV